MTGHLTAGAGSARPFIAAVLLALAAAPAAFGADRVYWANGNNTISFANLDGSGGGAQLDISGATSNGPRGVDIDPVTGRHLLGQPGQRHDLLRRPRRIGRRRS